MSIIPMRDLKNTVEVERRCAEENGPVYVLSLIHIYEPQRTLKRFAPLRGNIFRCLSAVKAGRYWRIDRRASQCAHWLGLDSGHPAEVWQTRGANQGCPLARAAPMLGGPRARPEMRLTVRRIYDIGKEVSEHDKKTVLFCCTGSAAARGWHPAPVQAPCRADRSGLSGQ